MNKFAPKISVIIPAYNVEKYIAKCLDSVASQTLRDIEIIVVDDGSPDSSGKIADEYAVRDKRIRVLHLKNSGSGPARNAGIKIARGEYIGFVDPDDWISENYFESLYFAAKKNDADIAATNNIRLVLDGSKAGKLKNAGFKHAGIVHGTIGRARIVLASGVAWNKIYRAQMVQKYDIKFYETRTCGQDNPFTIISIVVANKIATVRDAIYFYLQHDNSAIHARKEKDLGIVDMYADTCSRMRELKFGTIWNLLILRRARHDFNITYQNMDTSLQPRLRDKISTLFPNMRIKARNKNVE